MVDDSEVRLPDTEEPQLSQEPTPEGEGEEPAGEVEVVAEEAKREVKDWEKEYKNLQHTYDQNAQRAANEARQREQMLQYQLQLQQQQAYEAQLKARENWEREQYGDTQEVKDFQAQRRGLMQSAMALQQAETQSATGFKKAAAAELAEEYGVDYKELLTSGANNRMEMEAKARELQFEQKVTRLEESKRKPVDLSSPPPAGGGSKSWRDLSPDDKILKGIEEDERRPSKR